MKSLLALSAAFFVSASAQAEPTVIESCSSVAGKVAAQMFIGNLRMRMDDVRITVNRAEVENASTAYRVVVREQGDIRADETATGTYIAITREGSSGLCDILSLQKVRN